MHYKTIIVSECMVLKDISNCCFEGGFVEIRMPEGDLTTINILKTMRFTLVIFSKFSASTAGSHFPADLQ